MWMEKRVVNTAIAASGAYNQNSVVSNGGTTVSTVNGPRRNSVLNEEGTVS